MASLRRAVICAVQVLLVISAPIIVSASVSFIQESSVVDVHSPVGRLYSQTDTSTSASCMVACYYRAPLLVSASVSFIQEPSIVDVHSPVGRLYTQTDTSTGASCIVACYYEPLCVSAGFFRAYNACQLYDVDTAGFTYNVIGQADTVFYKAICKQGEDFTYVRRLGMCIHLSGTTKRDFADAKTHCAGHNASLIEVDTADKHEYLMDTLISIHGPMTDFEYLIGGRRTTPSADPWVWDSTDTEITVANGASHWSLGEPNVVNGTCLSVVPVDGSDVAFASRDCSVPYMFICAYYM